MKQANINFLDTRNRVWSRGRTIEDMLTNDFAYTNVDALVVNEEDFISLLPEYQIKEQSYGQYVLQILCVLGEDMQKGFIVGVPNEMREIRCIRTKLYSITTYPVFEIRSPWDWK